MNPSCDHEYMKLAFEEGRRSKRFTAPNPWVGCLIVRDGEIVGRGATCPPGGAHAEVNALSQAGDLSEGATAYVTLEPCSHFGATPPCVDALIKANLKRVVISVVDPDANVNGNGIQQLRRAGIHVETGVCSEQGEKEFAPYLYHRKTGLPYCILKTAMSLDGRIAASDGSSQWITGKSSRKNVHELRADSQAILVGSGTAIKDLPALTVRDAPLDHKPPLRVLLDARGRTKVNGPLFDLSLGPVLVYTTSKADQNTLNHWKKQGVEIVEVMSSSLGEGVHLPQVMKHLGKRGVLQALLEGGPTLHRQALEFGLVNKICLYMGNCFLGAGGKLAFELKKVKNISDADRWHLEEVETFGETVKLNYISL